MFAAIDNTVTLPGLYPRRRRRLLLADLGLRRRSNVENLFDTKYYANADSNNNISPAAPRTLRVGLMARF